ncbi:MAG: hypothetical protein K8F60_17695 [Melioribacteraceae bacterium]|jgi:lysophospholipase L1-like esterase|nr:GDSL family lipase [Ignavibacteriota bacterium]MBZ0184297.1 hypothetical protein [Melioribacteraceae bacterium]
MKTKYLFILIILISIPLAAQEQTTQSYLNNPNYKLQTDLYDIYKTSQADIVMLGNSLTQGVNWNELLGRSGVVNRGITSDVTQGFLSRMQYVYKLKPKICFIMGGVNDVYNWTPVQTIYENYLKIIAGLQARGIKPVIQSALYAGKDWGKDWLAVNRPELKPIEVNEGRNKEIDVLNTMLENFAKQNNIDYIDLNSLTKRGKFIKDELVYDGIHLNARGYKIWGAEVDKILKKYGL